MDIPKETQKKIQELQTIEQNLQVFIQQKQTMQVDSNEISNALSELESAKGDEVYKILSGIMIKISKEDSIKELTEKQKLTNSRIESIEKQESLLKKRSTELREELTKEMTSQTEKAVKSSDNEVKSEDIKEEN